MKISSGDLIYEFKIVHYEDNEKTKFHYLFKFTGILQGVDETGNKRISPKFNYCLLVNGKYDPSYLHL